MNKLHVTKNLKMKAATALTAMQTAFYSTSIALAQQGGANPADEATNKINDATAMMKVIFPAAAVLFGLIAIFLWFLGDKKRQQGMDWLMWVLLGLVAASALGGLVTYLWNP